MKVNHEKFRSWLKFTAKYEPCLLRLFKFFVASIQLHREFASWQWLR